MIQGKFIVLEGLDGSGKSTQTQLLLNALQQKGIQTEFIHFPRTDNSSHFYGPMLKRFLKGDLGSLDEVDPYFVAMLFAGDRKNEAEAIRDKLQQGIWVIADRYVLSNIAFQGAKLKTLEAREALAHWIMQTEFGLFELPRPDITLFLHMPFTFCENNVKNQRCGDDRDYLDGKVDIHEADLNFQKDVYQMYLYMLQHEEFELSDFVIGKHGVVPAPGKIHLQLLEQLNKIEL
ncbi:MAG: dTMP kinase [Bacteroidetes bacterium HGW-Bacteroidetes-6]|jgi:dTMP kinase|nr:MAG: dTMP kinase [Bacteroidetes bacterium HGW-Bacteroidetes-6]